jgi:hypothetical protein
VSATKKSPAKAKSTKAKSPTKATNAGVPASTNLYKYERDTATFQKIVQVIDANITQLRKAGVLFARPGYEQVKGLMTTRPAVVVTVANKRNVAPSELLPTTLGGFPVDVRQATFLERIRAEDPGRYAQIAASGGDEFAVAKPEQERVIATGQSTVGLLDAAFAARVPKKQLQYKAPTGFPLNVIEAPMAITCHVSPDAGWLQLKAFFAQIRSQLVTGMYDFTSAHILQELESDLRTSNAAFTLTLDDPPAENATADQSDPDTVSSLENALGSNFQEAWALVRSNRMVQEWIFPSAYHIKVAISDTARTWLSSGNWNNSNQPDIDPWQDRAHADEVAKDSDRDWHVIIDSPDVSALFEAYLKNDYQVATAAAKDQAASATALAGVADGLAQLTDAEVQAIDAEMAVAALAPRQYFEPLRIPSAGTQVFRIQPLLTPDKGSYAPHVLELLQQAQKSLFIQLQYVHPSDSPDNQDFIDLVDAVIERQRNNVDVRIIVSQWQLMQGWLDRFLQTGIDPNSVRIQHGVHNKGFVIDSKIVMLGSQNWSGQGVLQNRDASVIIYNEQAAQYYENVFLQDWENLAQPSSVISRPQATVTVPVAAAFLGGAPAVIPLLRTARQKTRFVMANRRAGKFGDARLVSRFAMNKTMNLLSTGIDVLADFDPPDEFARRVTVFDADPAEVVEKVRDPNVIVEPEILHWKEAIPPADLLPAPHEPSVIAMAADLTLDVTVTGGGAPLPNVTVILYSKTFAGLQKASNVTDGAGRARFPVASTSTPSAILVIPAGNFWTMVKRAPGLAETIDCPPLPTDGPLGWWHKLLGFSTLDLSAGKGVKVGVADTGCGPHECLQHVQDTGAFVGGTLSPAPAGTDVDSHGTHVCGIIGARPISRGQYGGMAPGADLYIARIFSGPDTGANQGDIANAIDALSRDRLVDLLNLSLGSTQPSQIEHDAIIDAYERGTVCVCAAGNDGGPVNWPGAFPECITASALGLLGWGPDGSLASTRVPTVSGMIGKSNYYLANFSSFGSQLLCAGPGVGIISSVPERFGLKGPYLAMDGTSMASPAVCGLLAVLLSNSKEYAAATSRDRGRSDVAKTVLRSACVDMGLALQYQGLGVPSK